MSFPQVPLQGKVKFSAGKLRANVAQNLAARNNSVNNLNLHRTRQQEWAGVKSEDQAYEYYKENFPYYGDTLCKALAKRIADIVQTSDKLTPEQRLKYTTTDRETWDPMEDIQREIIDAREKMAKDSAEKLLKELEL